MADTLATPESFAAMRVPGDPAWHLAPRGMAWEGKTLGQICAQIKDPARNGGRSLEDIVQHVGTDHLVGWAWAPGGDRNKFPYALTPRKCRCVAISASSPEPTCRNVRHESVIESKSSSRQSSSLF
jgi:hypothetical protein